MNPPTPLLGGGLKWRNGAAAPGLAGNRGLFKGNKDVIRPVRCPGPHRWRL